MDRPLALKIKNIYMSFGPTRALEDVSLDLFGGEIRGFIGENGSGKSTLSNVVAGLLKADSGVMELFGKHYAPHSMLDADKNKVSMIVQEMATINKISVAANIFAGKETQFGKFGMINKKAMNKAAQAALERIGVTWINPSTLTDKISFEDRKLVEMARAVNNEPEILIIDETTTALSQSGRTIMYKIMQELRNNGKSILFISHDLSEIIEQCDSVTVLRDGQIIDTLGKDQMEIHKIQYLMIGRNINEDYYREDYDGSCMENVVLKLDNICLGNLLRHVSLELHQGEILGIGGLSESGMHELGKVAFGMLDPDVGTVVIPENNIAIKSPIAAIKNKMGYVSKNRDQEGLLMASTIKHNICLPSLNNLKKGFLITRKSERNLTLKMKSVLDIKMNSINQFCMNLSGGNKQKVVLSKWLGNGSDILILDCPTRGIDIGVKQAIYKLMQELKAGGKSMIMISEELPELIGMSDNILIMKDGKISGSFERSAELNEAQIIKYMIS